MEKTVNTKWVNKMVSKMNDFTLDIEDEQSLLTDSLDLSEEELLKINKAADDLDCAVSSFFEEARNQYIDKLNKK